MSEHHKSRYLELGFGPMYNEDETRYLSAYFGRDPETWGGFTHVVSVDTDTGGFDIIRLNKVHGGTSGGRIVRQGTDSDPTTVEMICRKIVTRQKRGAINFTAPKIAMERDREGVR